MNDIGYNAFGQFLTERVIKRLSERYFGEELFTQTLDHHHTFSVAYKVGEESEMKDAGSRGLDMHHDAAEVTLNVCLGRDKFTASGLRFCGHFGSKHQRKEQCQVQHRVGQAILHLGRHRHGADDIQSGERVNLIVWARSSAFRAAAAFQHVPPDGYPREKEDAANIERVCLSAANDQDYNEKLLSFAHGAVADET